MTPQVVLRAADLRPFELQDVLPSDTRFKIIVFVGDLESHGQRSRVEKFAEEIHSEGGLLRKFGGEDWTRVFVILTVLIGTKATVDYTVVPAGLRSHWSK